MAWSYQRQEQSFDVIPEGKYRVRIKSAEKAVSKTGRDMIVLQLNVSGYSSILYYYLVFMTDRPEITNRNLTALYDSFPAIQEGDTNISNWVGKVGACTVKHEDYNGQESAKVGYFIPEKRQADLPPYQEADGRKVTSDGFEELTKDAENLPF